MIYSSPTTTSCQPASQHNALPGCLARPLRHTEQIPSTMDTGQTFSELFGEELAPGEADSLSTSLKRRRMFLCPGLDFFGLLHRAACLQTRSVFQHGCTDVCLSLEVLVI